VTRPAQSCKYADARRGRLAHDQPCPACGVVGAKHVRECERCGADISAEDVADLVDADGHLYCDDCEVSP
jgi:hypothetical protein